MLKATLLALLLALHTIAQAAGPEPQSTAPQPAQVMVVGLFHLANPGRDMHNVQVDDVLAERRQAELARITDGLARFAPTTVMFEWPAALTDERYAKYRAGTLGDSRNEVVQLGFRLASRMELDRVHGIDVEGEFPFGPVKAFADSHGQGARIDAGMAEVGRKVQDMSRRLAEGSIGSVLRHMNTPESAADSHAFYMDMLRYGDADEQPGAALVSAWYARNLAICARLLQALPAGGRAVVFYGDGHSYLLRQCVIEAPGVELVEANDFLVE